MQESKPWWMSKTVWSSVITGVIGVYLTINQASGGTLPQIPDWILILLGALGVYGRASADKRIG